MWWRVRTPVVWLALGVGCFLSVGCGLAASGTREVAAHVGHAASCAAQTPSEQRDRAELIVDAVARGGHVDPQSILLSPARFRVVRYLKGHGPRLLRVRTQVTAGGGGYSYGEDGIAPRARERWRLYGRRTRDGVIATGICAGSRRLRRAPRTAAHNRRAALRDARRLLRRAVVPRDAVPLSTEPNGDGGFLTHPGERLGGLLVDRHRWWRSPSRFGSVVRFLERHRPRDSRRDGSGGEGGPGVPRNRMLAFGLAPIRGVVSERELVFQVVALEDGGTGVRVDAEEVWILPRPASERIPAGVREVDVTSARPGTEPTVSTTVTTRAKVRRLVALIDAMPIVQPGTVSCPAFPAGRPVVSFRFRAAPGGPALARARLIAYGFASGPCNPVSLDIRGHPRRPLIGGDFLRKAHRLLTVRLR